MPAPNEALRSPAPTASSTLLSAALGGLVWLTTSCRASPEVRLPDANESADTGVIADTGVGEDSGLDAGMDASTPMDASAPMDASTPMEASTALDGGLVFRDAPCDADPDRSITASDAAPGMTLEEFTAMCDALGGSIEIHPHCGGMNSCAGVSYDQGTGVLTEHTCRGLNTCQGFSCRLP